MKIGDYVKVKKGSRVYIEKHRDGTFQIDNIARGREINNGIITNKDVYKLRSVVDGSLVFSYPSEFELDTNYIRKIKLNKLLDRISSSLY